LQMARQLTAFIAAASILLGIFSLTFQSTLPLMIVEGRFTLAASIINIIGGIFFCYGSDILSCPLLEY